MPQVDLATFFDIVSWTAVSYVACFYLLTCQKGSLTTFLASTKVGAKRLEHTYTAALLARKQLSVVQLFPWISL